MATENEHNGYELSRSWFDFSFENPDKVRPIHTAIFFFACEHYNRMGKKPAFGFPTTMAMEALGVKSYNTYIKAFNDIVDWGFFKLVEKSKNQYSSNIIALSKNDEASNKALDKALLKHSTKHCRSTQQSIDSINKQYNKEQVNKDIVNFSAVVEYYHTKCPNLPKVKKLTDARKKLITARFEEHGREEIGEVIEKASKSEFLNGNSDRGWKANFDWIFKASNFLKISEGAYNRQAKPRPGTEFVM